ncbi:MAG: hypothetical protein A2655_00200 [Candidatus Yanofskybacteria bacterium RIFCSPHIGHO2_01_FULL_43_42]|uniref:Uncharacterized protein n=1 Tax=Candidatus Yanofskybacteria bacterium RIFCSPLOWO2_01_FULL_43_22 TaxID=1802695 RepID=A0A1F8GEA6_9BACT|nr:MAG: hypothetical protein A2655_00200 [Candidatus Yanofskybacteria bacterium RIFCSPHIGHO2_01_FULL_43_42]OGN12568.1 MAG: hypothetical protein A3D48_04530 [Candidatus Yanofskybacteria bacterium RIFCSPHIGHO2_02_FULL_43_17]OGN23715.1 MAG: hypothetical protein A3A13_00190 [Candidatus Yanofskybacteria bacterium RIFCSPLOWO2_01_FULL_43_22]
MDTQELKKLLKGSTAVLILENGEPSFVILGYDAYRGLLSDQEKEVKINHSAEVESGRVEQPKQVADGRVSVANRFQHRIGEKEAEMLEKINKQILALKDEVEKEEKSTVVDE